MPEVFTFIFFVAWLHERKLVPRVKASSSWFNCLFYYQELHIFYHHNKNNEVNKKLLAVFSTATCFALPEIHWREEVISLPL